MTSKVSGRVPDDFPLWEQIPSEPKLTNLSKDYGRIPAEVLPALEDLATPHIKSFDWMCEDGIRKAIMDLPALNFEVPTSKQRIALKITDARINSPKVPPNTIGIKDYRVYPTECRQRCTSYTGDFIITLTWWLNGTQQLSIEKDLGAIPIMVKVLQSKLCHLNKLSPKEMVAKGEHETEFGGYFISKGHEKLIRLLLMTRANFPLFLSRSSWVARGRNFTDKGVLIRCVREDRTSLNNVMHYLSDGSAKLMFNVGPELFFVPIVMIFKALVDVTDEFIYKKCIEGFEDDFFFKGHVAEMLRDSHREGIHFHHQAKVFIGSKFRAKIEKVIGEWRTDAECCDFLIERGVCIHCNTPMEKFFVLVSILQKLYAGVQDKIYPESPDHVMCQEVLLGGHLYLQLIKDKLEHWLHRVEFLVKRKAALDPAKEIKPADVIKAVQSAYKLDQNFGTFIATGNLPIHTGRTLPQRQGLTIVVENINRLRYLAHFRSIHRGAFFQELRTTDCRQLQPDAFGFICPVHTPDGSPCGLLNHLTAFCRVVTEPLDSSKIPSILMRFGMVPITEECPYNIKKCYQVALDGKILGYIKDEDTNKIMDKLREIKIEGVEIPKYTELAFVPKRKNGQYPGLYIFTSQARMMRPVINLKYENKIEYIGTFEQVYMDICMREDEAYPGLTTHKEIFEGGFLSHLASLIPMPDCNQSPRNMYQCQMSKQTMGSPWHTYHRFAETKLYRLYFPGAPFFRPTHYDYLKMDDYPQGTNAIVAIISYTGYDMEDAMIINKSSFERGFGYGCIYKTEHVDLKLILKNPTTQSTFQRDPKAPELAQFIGEDGLPHIGQGLNNGDPYFCYFNAEQAKYTVMKFKGAERVYVDSVKLKSNDSGSLEKSNAAIITRVPKYPKIGDKFASRAGQKGICSYLWPTEDLPYTASGLLPDIVFNPHGFPSRMTIAMMIEVLAGKSGALHGLVHDATPFKFSETDSAAEYFGNLLVKGGYNYYGTERMYSGTSGRELTADIFFGIVHYQRLRHMVSEKWQVRSTGPLDPVTHQPIKGRRKGGGVRFGEMEKDCLISHGASFLLQDRLFYCSDRTTTKICIDCGSIISPIIKISEMPLPGSTHIEIPKAKCAFCGSQESVETIEIPHVFKYLVEQLASCNIKLKIKTGHI